MTHPACPAEELTISPYEAPPLALMLSSPARRRYRKWALLCTLVASAAVGSVSRLYPDSAGIWLTLGALVTLVYPFLTAYQDASIIGMLRYGRSLDEILTTRMSSSAWIDSVVHFSFVSTLKSTPWLCLAMFGQILAYVKLEGAFPENWILAPVLWCGLCLTVNLVSCNIFLVCAVCDRIDMDSPIGVGWGATAILMGMYGLANGGSFGLALMAIGVLCFVMACRQLALEWLQRGDSTPVMTEGQKRPSTNRFQRPYNENPIVIRESARLARKLSGGGVPAVLFYHHGLFFLVLALAALFLPQRGLEIAWYVFPALFILQPLMASMNVSTSLVEERERRTLESLALTQIKAEEFLDGWASFGWRYRVSESLFMVLYCLVVAFQTQTVQPLAIVPAYLWLLGSCYLAAYLGVLASTQARSRAQAGSFALGYVGLMQLVLGVSCYLGQWYDNLLLILAVAGAAYLVRRRALRMVEHT